MRTSITNTKKGFTLIELLVAVALFTVVMVVSVAAILSIIGGNRKSQAINGVVNNLNFAIESMVRDMKTGFLYKCPDNNGDYPGEGWPIGQSTANLCPSPDNPVRTVAFFSTLSGTPEAVEYHFQPAGGVQAYGVIRKKTVVNGTTRVEDITSPDINIKEVRMYVNSPLPASQKINANEKSQPSIFLIISGDARISDTETSRFGLQTFISQRILNL
ncbi:MAG: prepilin-type N-terminal cleavage/methylation domain-containing protein [Candidatus Taylorbacteria bacterium]|nr:prepilin-type N-terminal cleavage/methylation domain-containing protein [Candidatus Taylorbacteria bacterium]